MANHQPLDDQPDLRWLLTKTVRYRHLSTNPRVTIIIHDLASTDHTLHGIKVRGPATLEDAGRSLRIGIRPTTIWSCGINKDAPTRFAGVEKRQIPSQQTGYLRLRTHCPPGSATKTTAVWPGPC